jgi:hypothetical protein
VVGAAIAAIALGTVFAVGSGGAASAAAAEELLLSRDGVHYSSSLDGALFERAGSLVPGQHVTASLWIKNPTGTSASLRMSVHGVTWSPGAVAGALNVTGTVVSPLMADAPVPAAGLQPCAVLLSVPSIPAGAAVHIDVQLNMADVGTTMAQSQSVAVDFLVAMKDVAGGPFGASACNDGGVVVGSTNFRSVAFTGGTLPVPPIIGGGLLIGVGIFLVARRRERSERG